MSQTSVTVAELLYTMRTQLADSSDAPTFEARRLLAFGLGQTVDWLYKNPEYVLASTDIEKVDGLVAQRRTGYPLAYILGEWGFYHWDFVVNEHVLIPRQETEILVEEALNWAKAYLTQNDSISIVDVGTGSGIIAVSMALSLPQALIWAVDVSPEALAIAQTNAQHLGANNIRFQASNLLHDVAPQKFNLILANLPYIRHDDMHELAVSQHEPHLALDGGLDGLDLIKILLRQANAYLAEGGAILLEIGDAQGQAVEALAKSELLNETTVNIIQDLGGRDRVVKIVSIH